MSEDLTMVLAMYQAWKAEGGLHLLVPAGSDLFFRGVPVRQLEEMERAKAQEEHKER